MSASASLTALLIAPNRAIAAQFQEKTARACQIAADLDAYPSAEQLQARLRQRPPNVLFIDVASDLQAGTDLIRCAGSLRPPLPVVALHVRNDSEAVLRSLRSGAAEFLYIPFEASTHDAALARLRNLIYPAGQVGPRNGSVVSFTNAKPGSGSTTIAVEAAHSIARNAADRRVLLVDFDVVAGMVAFYLRLNCRNSITSLLGGDGPNIKADAWASAVVSTNGFDVLPAPVLACADPIAPGEVSRILSYARTAYDWIIVDLPNVFARLSLMAIAEADRSFLVTTPELPSLHLTRRAVKLLGQLGIDSVKYQVLINRLEGRQQLSNSELSQLFASQVDDALPMDSQRLERAHASGERPEATSGFQQAIERLAAKIASSAPEGKPRRGAPSARTLNTSV
jgi:pilus assembly protein CpaE